MDYYDRRARVYQQLKIFLNKRQEAISNNHDPPSLSGFMHRMVMEYGVTTKMIKTMLEELVPGATILNGEIVKVENE